MAARAGAMAPPCQAPLLTTALFVAAALSPLPSALGAVVPGLVPGGWLHGGLPLAPSRLRVEHAAAPRGVASTSPALSWALQHTGRAQAPSQFEVLVRRVVPAAPAGNIAVVVWAANVSTGAGPAQLPVAYNSDGHAIPLVSDADYTWAVRWWDTVGNVSPWSAPANFTTALLSPGAAAGAGRSRGGYDSTKDRGDGKPTTNGGGGGGGGDDEWHGAAWIGTDGPGHTAPFQDPDERNRFRVEFNVSGGSGTVGGVARCSLMIAGLGYYRAALEGAVLAGDHQLGESTQFQRRIPYDNLDCTAALRAAVTAGAVSGGADNNVNTLRPPPSSSAQSSTQAVALAVELGRGWYGEQQLKALGNRPSGARMLRCLLTATYADGTVQRVTSDPTAFSWRRGAGPVVWDQLHLGIVYDAGRETPGWDRAGFDDSAWAPVTHAMDLTATRSEVGWGRLAAAQMVASLHPPVRKTRQLTPVAVRLVPRGGGGASGGSGGGGGGSGDAVPSGSSSTYVVDLGENIAGWCRYALAPSASGANVTFLHAERLDPATGTVTRDVQPLTQNASEQTVFVFPPAVAATGAAANAAAIVGEKDAAAGAAPAALHSQPVVAAAAATVVFEPRFVSYGFRYVQLTGPLANAPQPADITCWSVHTDLDVTGSFSFVAAAPAGPTNNDDDDNDDDDDSDDNTSSGHSAAAASAVAGAIALEQALWRNYNATARSAEANFISFPTDCPHRERRGWLGDAGAASGTLLARFDMAAAYTKWLDDVADTTALSYSNGNIGTIAPQYAATCTGPPAPPLPTGKTAVAWSAAFVLVWDATWRHANDRALAARHYDLAKAYVDFLGGSRNATTGVLPVDWGGALLGDWCAAIGVNGTGDPGPFQDAYSARHVSGLFNTFYYILTHAAFLRAHEALGKPAAAAAAARARLAAAAAGFNAVFYDPTRATYADRTVAADPVKYGPEPLQTALSLALELRALGLLPDPGSSGGGVDGSGAGGNATVSVQAALLRDVTATRGGRMTSGLIGTKYLFSNLARIQSAAAATTALLPAGVRGSPSSPATVEQRLVQEAPQWSSAGVDAALDVLQGAESPSYGFMFAQGPGDTLWESPDGNASWHRPRGSLNHIMLGGHAGPFFFGQLAGIALPPTAAAAGWAAVDVAPAVTRHLAGFRAELLTVRGPVRSAWAWRQWPTAATDAGGFVLNVTVPVGARANVTFPDTAAVAESGTVVWQGGAFVPGAAMGVVGGGEQPLVAGVRLEVASGDYFFEATSAPTRAAT